MMNEFKEGPRVNELDEIRARYLRRDTRRLEQQQGWDAFSVLCGNERKEALFKALQRRFPDRGPDSLTALDIGCGAGGSLLQFVEMGFDPAKLVGIDLISSRASNARGRLPQTVRILEGDATTMQIPEGQFDIVQQSTVFTSILDDDVQVTLARRMWHLLAPRGLIIWYDFAYNNPRNRDVRGVPVSRIRELFPQGKHSWRRITLAPPLGRYAAPLSTRLYLTLNSIPLLRSHVFATIDKD